MSLALTFYLIVYLSFLRFKDRPYPKILLFSNELTDCASTDTMHMFVENVYNYALEKSEKARRTSGQVGNNSIFEMGQIYFFISFFMFPNLNDYNLIRNEAFFHDRFS